MVAGHSPYGAGMYGKSDRLTNVNNRLVGVRRVVAGGDPRPGRRSAGVHTTRRARGLMGQAQEARQLPRSTRRSRLCPNRP